MNPDTFQTRLLRVLGDINRNLSSIRLSLSPDGQRDQTSEDPPESHSDETDMPF